jgi:hypothetical protein
MTCRTPAELRRHEGTHDSSKRFKCAVCSAMLKSEGSLKLHVRNVHEKPTEKTIACKVSPERRLEITGCEPTGL